jgi:hypothetical protein
MKSIYIIILALTYATYAHSFVSQTGGQGIPRGTVEDGKLCSYDAAGDVQNCQTDTTAVSPDDIGTSELDDGADTPASGEYIRVDTVDQAGIEYRSVSEVLSDIGAESSTSNDIDPDRLAGDTVDDNAIDAAILPAVTAMASACTDAQVLGGDGASGIECQTDDDTPDDDTEVPNVLTLEAGSSITEVSIILQDGDPVSATTDGNITYGRTDEELYVGDGVGASRFTKTGTLTDTKLCTYNLAGKEIICTTDATAVTEDDIGTTELDDGADNPGSGEYIRVDTVDQAGIEYRSTAEVLSDIAAESATSNNIDPDRLLGDSVDDNAIDASIIADLSGEYPTAIGDCTDGSCLVDGDTYGTDFCFVYEGSVANDFETQLCFSGNPTGDSKITLLNDQGGNVLTTTSAGSTVPAAGSDTQFLYNSGGVIAGIAAITYDGNLRIAEGAGLSVETVARLPNGTNPSMVNPGYYAVDTTIGQALAVVKDVDTPKVLRHIDDKCLTIPDPTGDENYMIYSPERAMTVISLKCIVEDATSVVATFNECDANGANCDPIDTVGITCGQTMTHDDGNLSNPAIVAGGVVRVALSDLTGTPGHVMACLVAEETRQ